MRTNIDGPTETTMVRPSRPWVAIEAEQGQLFVAGAYLRHGVEHIFFGIDHLLSIASLMLIVRDWRVLVKTITAFTVAHSITLAPATFGLVTLPAQPAEAMVAR